MATIKISDILHTPADGKTTVKTVKVDFDGEPCEIDLTSRETAALLSMFREGHDLAPVRALLATETATAAIPAKRATGTAKTDSKADTAALLADVKAWADRNEHDTAEIKSWAHANGFPHVEPSKAGRIAADVWIAYSEAHGGPAAPAPADSDTPAADASKTPAPAPAADAAKTTVTTAPAPAKNAKTPAAVK